jgi:ABC-type dipeptide/oligopeptide/nickel transport system permease component
MSRVDQDGLPDQLLLLGAGVGDDVERHGGMRYIARRAGMAVVVLLLAVTLNFVVIRAAPGTYSGNQSMPAQFLQYVGHTLEGNFGIDYANGHPVSPEIWAAVRISLPLLLFGTAIGIVVGIVLGLIAGARSGGLIDAAIVTIASVAYSLPVQLIGILLLSVFAGVLPSGGRSDPLLYDRSYWTREEDVLKHFILPSLALALTTFGIFVLVTRSSMLQLTGEDFVVTAKAKGYSRWRIVTREMMRPASLPVAALAGLSFGTVIGSALIIEVLFSWPGLGMLAYQAIETRDVPVVEATFLISTLGVVVMNFLVDCLYTVLDPRVRAP